MQAKESRNRGKGIGLVPMPNLTFSVNGHSINDTEATTMPMTASRSAHVIDNSLVRFQSS